MQEKERINELLFAYRLIHMLEKQGMESTMKWYVYTSSVLNIDRGAMNTMVNKVLISIKNPEKSRRYIAACIAEMIPDLGWTRKTFRDTLRLPTRLGRYAPHELKRLTCVAIKVPHFDDAERKLIAQYLEGVERIRKVL